MLKQYYDEYTELDYRMYYLCNALSRVSDCKDKQVGAVILDANNNIVGSGYNRILDCNKRCNKSCEVTHAEIMAVNNSRKAATAYVNLFPCLTCQEALWKAGIKEVRVFGKQGNKALHPCWESEGCNLVMYPDLPRLLLDFNGDRNARQVVQGELAELITAISNLDARNDRPEAKWELLADLRGEMVDVELQTFILHLSLPLESVSMRGFQKWNRLIKKFRTIFFPGIDL